MALAKKAIHHALYALANTSTTSPDAKNFSPGIKSTQPSQCEPANESWYSERGRFSSASTGNDPMAVSPADMTASTFVRDVPPQPMELISALEHRKLKALTPYHPDMWEHYLIKAGLTTPHAHIIQGL